MFFTEIMSMLGMIQIALTGLYGVYMVASSQKQLMDDNKRYSSVSQEKKIEIKRNELMLLLESAKNRLKSSNRRPNTSCFARFLYLKDPKEDASRKKAVNSKGDCDNFEFVGQNSVALLVNYIFEKFMNSIEESLAKRELRHCEIELLEFNSKYPVKKPSPDKINCEEVKKAA